VNDSPAPPAARRSYKIALTVAIVLLLLTLTGALLAIILADAEEQQRTADLALTLTQAFASLDQTATALAPLPADAPPVASGEFPFAAPGGVELAGADSCEAQAVGGTVLDREGRPLDGFQIALWGDYVDARTLLTGPLAEQEAGRWTAALEGNLNRRVWVQLVGDRRTLSAPVEIVLVGGDCARNRATVTFRQVGEMP